MLYFDTSRDQEEVKTPLVRPLFNDMVACERLLQETDTQFARRVFFRCAFAFIEGTIYWLQGIALTAALNHNLANGRSINVTLVSALIDDTPRVGKTGKITLDPNRIPFLNHTALVLRTLVEAFELHAEDMFADNGWAEMQKAVEVRHRITHPKEPDELTIADAEMRSLREALSWLFSVTAAIVEYQTKRPGEKARAGV